jgi:hypothetical protein
VPRFLRRPILNLRADGSLVDSGASVFSLDARPLVVVARALCQFQSIPLPEGLKGGKAVKAAVLVGQASQPFADTGSFVARFGDSFRAWNWDNARIESVTLEGDALGRVEAIPESATQPMGDGWRIVACEQGYDAQFWDGGAPVALQWRPTPFDRASWFAFARSCASDTAFPDEPPSPIRPMPRYQGGVLTKRVGQPLEFDPILIAGTAAATLLTTSIAYDAARLYRVDQELAKVTAALAARKTTSEAIRSAGDDIANARRDIGAFNEVARAPQPLQLMAIISQQSSLGGAKLKRWALADGRLQAVFDLPPKETVTTLVQTLETLPDFSNVAAEVDRGQRRLTLSADVGDVSTGAEPAGGPR